MLLFDDKTSIICYPVKLNSFPLYSLDVEGEEEGESGNKLWNIKHRINDIGRAFEMFFFYRLHFRCVRLPGREEESTRSFTRISLNSNFPFNKPKRLFIYRRENLSFIDTLILLSLVALKRYFRIHSSIHLFHRSDSFVHLSLVVVIGYRGNFS